ncbi:putative assembly chaperone of rpl4 [Psilocybe cubensis]|uniref:Assembly chaperone of rpl4 n=2 Tax=Psilocybe cubensis TaxID=181762 RepID=A0ACB8H133_PSICU|nr:putative assembly chaperone of rpl4 [Psilocybe cubensis]KAH9481382.1 putative assembly chaperone of rpl4 [Psilocybe cubensis]
MGRTRPKKKGLSKPGDAPAKSSPPSTESLLEKAQALIVQCDYELAVRFIRRALEQDPKNAEAREMLGVSLLELGDLDAAKETFLSLIPPSPDAPSPSPPSAHLYLAQLSEDDPRGALKHYQAAIHILHAQLKGKERADDEASKKDESELRSNIVRALVGQVEIWMDPSYDLCDEPEAEQNCEDLLSAALKIDPGNPEALQTLASVRMSQERPDEAKAFLEQAWATMQDIDLDDPKLPPIPTRLALVKLFLELSLYTPALLVLHGIMSSDDQDVEAWYLEGWCFYLMAEQAQENGGKLEDLTWQELGRDSRDCLETCQVLHRNQEHPDKPLLEHVQELIAKLDELGITASPVDEGEEGEDGEGEWESDDGSVDGDGDVEMQ